MSPRLISAQKGESGTPAREGTPAVTPTSTSRSQGTRQTFMYAGRAALNGDGGPFDGFEVYTSDMTQLGRIAAPELLIDIFPTGNELRSLVMTLSTSAMIDLEQGEIAEIKWPGADPGWSFSTASVPNGSPMNPDWLVTGSMDMTRVLLINLTTLEGTDITEYVNLDNQEIVPTLIDALPDSNLGGLWTGNNCYLLSWDDPSSATRLVGDKEGWYSTTLKLSPDASWCGYTTYSPQSRGTEAAVFFQHVDSGEVVELATGTAWSMVEVIPNDPDHLLVIANGELQLRSVSDPVTTIETLLPMGDDASRFVWSADGSTVAVGSKADSDSALIWTWLNMASGESKPLDELTDLEEHFPRSAEPRSAYTLFTREPMDEVTGDVVGLDLATGETAVLLEGMTLDASAAITSTSDGQFYTLASQTRGEEGMWVMDLASQSVTELPYGNGVFTISGGVSPDGESLVYTLVERPGEVYSTVVAKPASPEDTQEVTDLQFICWT